MRTYLRARVAGGLYVFTVVTHMRRPVLAGPGNVALLREAFRVERERHPFTIDAIVVLPDHLHTIWQLPEDDDDFPGRWARIKGRFSRLCADRGAPVSASRRRRRERAVWQRRYWEHLIRNEAELQAMRDYIHMNPVRHGLVRTARDWPYSSFHRFVRQEVYPPDWGQSDWGQSDWGQSDPLLPPAWLGRIGLKPE